MLVTYKFELRYRRRSDNINKLDVVKTTDKDGNEIFRKVGGKPYTEYYTHSLGFNDEERAYLALNRLKRRSGIRYARLLQHEFKVEETSI